MIDIGGEAGLCLSHFGFLASCLGDVCIDPADPDNRAIGCEYGEFADNDGPGLSIRIFGFDFDIHRFAQVENRHFDGVDVVGNTP